MSKDIGEKIKSAVAKLFGIPMPAVDPMHFLVDEEIRPFRIDHRHDLTGTGRQACPTVSTGIFIVHEHEVPKDQCEVIHGYFGHCWERTQPGTGDESAQLISPDSLAGYVLFTPSKNTNDYGITIEYDYNAPTIQATPNDRDRRQLSGDTFLSADAPALASMHMRSPLGCIYLPGGAKFRVLFRLAPVATTKTAPAGEEETPIPVTYSIGAPAAPPPNVPTKRIDFAGAAVWGVRMPQRLYGTLIAARRSGLLGPEAARLIDQG